MLKLIRRFFCNHTYEWHRLPGYVLKDGWMTQIGEWRCSKCGKVRGRGEHQPL